jgi:hypothetical protein
VRGDDAAYVRPVVAGGRRVVVVVHEVPASVVVDEPVGVVVDPVLRHLAGIPPGVLGEVGMVVEAPVVDHGDRHARGVGDEVPRLRSVDVRVGRSGRLAVHGLPGVVERPLLAEARVVRDGRRLRDVVGLGVEDVGSALEPPDGAVHRAGAELEDLKATDAEGEVVLHARIHRRAGARAVAGVGARREADDQLAGGGGRLDGRGGRCDDEQE